MRQRHGSGAGRAGRWLGAGLAAGLWLALSAGPSAAVTIGVSIANLSYPFLQGLRAAMERAAAATPGVELVIVDARGDAGLQAGQVADFVARGVDAIIVNLVNSDAGLAISSAVGKVPLVYVNQPPINHAILPAGQVYVGSDERESGTLQMNALCQRLGGQGTVVLLIGQLTTYAARQRSTDVYEVLGSPACKGVTLGAEAYADWDRAKARQLVAGWLAAGQQIDAVAANNDEMALGAADALGAAGVAPGEVLVAGVDGTPGALAALQAGQLSLTVFQNAAGQAEAALKAAGQLAAGEAVQGPVHVPFELVTPDRVASYKARP